MTISSEETKADKELVKALNDVTKSIRDLQNADEILPRRRYLFFFVRGVMQGLGVVVAAIIIIPLLIPFIMFSLRQIEWVPIVGNFATKVIMQVDRSMDITPAPVDQ